MPEQVTKAMSEAMLFSWFGPRWAEGAPEEWADILRNKARIAITAALDAAPSGHGERG